MERAGEGLWQVEAAGLGLSAVVDEQDGLFAGGAPGRGDDPGSLLGIALTQVDGLMSADDGGHLLHAAGDQIGSGLGAAPGRQVGDQRDERLLLGLLDGPGNGPVPVELAAVLQDQRQHIAGREMPCQVPAEEEGRAVDVHPAGQADAVAGEAADILVQDKRIERDGLAAGAPGQMAAEVVELALADIRLGGRVLAAQDGFAGHVGGLLQQA